MVDTFSCTECGRCQDVCPAYNTGKELSPKLLIMGLRDQLFAEGPDLVAMSESAETGKPLVPNAVSDDVVWDCVTCGACVYECPVSIEHVDHIVDLRRHLVMVEARFPAEADPMLRDVERASNPWGKPQSERAAWAEGLGVRVLEEGDPPPEVLYWVGCAGSFDERARQTAVSTARLLQAAGVDFAILGPRESCTGDPARRMGNEYVFQAFAEQNVETLNGHGVDEDRHRLPALLQHAGQRVPRLRRHATRCSTTPSCWPSWCERAGSAAPAATDRSPTTTPATWPATTTSSTRPGSWSPRRARRWRWSAAASARSAAAPAAPTCGWRSGAARSTRSGCAQAAETGADTLAVACPFCTVMLDDGVRSSGADMRVADVATLLAETLPGETQSAAVRPNRRTSRVA